MTKLKPCPFCGGEVILMAIAGDPFSRTYKVPLEKVTKQSDDICYVHCPCCKANWHKEVRLESFPIETIESWNRRADNG